MDIFVEKIVSKKKGTKEYLTIAAIVFAAIVVAFLITPVLLQNGIIVFSEKL